MSVLYLFLFFFFKQKTAYEMRISDWSSDVCSSDLHVARLGVDAIWLSPFYTSPMADFGYDVADYRDVDPIFGTLADFDALVAHAHALGLKVLIDQVWRSEEHTSELQSLMRNSYAVFCLKKKKTTQKYKDHNSPE